MKCSVPHLIRVAATVVGLGIAALLSQAPPPGGGDAGQSGEVDPGLRSVMRIECAELEALRRNLEAAGREAVDRCEIALVRTTVSLVRACEAVKALLPNPPHHDGQGGKPGNRSNLFRSMPLG